MKYEIAQIITTFVGFGVLVYQVHKGFENSFALKNREIKDAYHKELHEKIEIAISNLHETTSTMSSCLLSIKIAFGNYADMQASGIANPIMSVDSSEQVRLKSAEMGEAIFQVLGTIEKYEIVEPKLNIFKIAFSSYHHDYSKIFHGRLYRNLLPVLPFSLSDGTCKPFVMPNEERLKTLIKDLDAAYESISNIKMVIYDLRIEIQNLLLSELFDRKLELRKPIDPKIKVISSQSYDELNQYFEKETNYGKSNSDAVNRVLEDFIKQDTNL